jgi:hypothetical protein
MRPYSRDVPEPAGATAQLPEAALNVDRRRAISSPLFEIVVFRVYNRELRTDYNKIIIEA